MILYNGIKEGTLARLRELALEDFERSAKRILPRSLHAFVAAGSEDGRTRDANRQAFARCRLKPRVLRDVSERSAAVEIFGKCFTAPIGIAPMGMAGACRFEGDLALARAAGEASLPFMLSGAAFEPMERVAAEAPGSWFQAYLSGDPARDAGLVRRIADAGYEVLTITVDTPVPPSREASLRAGGLGIPVRPSVRLALDTALHPGWAWNTFAATLLRKGIPRLANMSAGGGARITDRPEPGKRPRRDRVRWDDLARLRDQWPGRLVIKGVVHPGDALQAQAIGVDAVIVSNHGGRQLDGTIDTLSALSDVKAAVGTMPVFFDGGVRRGGDVAKAIASGASLVFVGRPLLFALAAHGQAGVAHALALLQEELLRAMALLGCSAIAEIGRDRISLPNDDHRPAG